MRTRKSQMGITELPFEIRRTYRQACKRGYMDGYTSPAWRKTFVGAFLTKYPNRTAVLDALAEAFSLITEAQFLRFVFKSSK